MRPLIARESQQPWIDREGASYELPMTLPQPVIAEPFSFLIRTVCRHSFFLEASIDQVCTERLDGIGEEFLGKGNFVRRVKTS